MKCPKCGYEYERLLALSREDNKTMICGICGMKEALHSFSRVIEMQLVENFNTDHKKSVRVDG